jgi:DNA polymerase
MSDQATDLVFDALSQMDGIGAHPRATTAALARLQATATSAPAAAKPAPARTEPTPPPRASPIPRLAPAPEPVAIPPPAATSGSKAGRLAALRGPVLACTLCPHLVQSRTQVVFGVGKPDAELMFVGEAPGADEDIVGEPFVGRAGQLLTKMIEAMGFRRTEVYIANVLKCRPDVPQGESGNRKPTHDEMNVCKPYLLQQIDIVQPKVLVALGATAVEGLLGIEKAGITRMRGNWKEFHGTPVMPTFHPSFLLRPTSEQLANKRLIWEDMLQVLGRLGRPITAKQQGYFQQKS